MTDRMIYGGKYMQNLEDTIQDMVSSDYRKRFVAEYQQTKIRRDKLNRLVTKIEAATGWDWHLEEPKHDCPIALLREQLTEMERYLHILEIRAVIEGIDLY